MLYLNENNLKSVKNVTKDEKGDNQKWRYVYSICNIKYVGLKTKNNHNRNSIKNVTKEEKGDNQEWLIDWLVLILTI
jgi:hypothetical protein